MAENTSTALGQPTQRGASRELLILLEAFVLGGIAIWLLREEWAKAAFWPWLLLLAAMSGGAWSLKRLEPCLRGEPILPRPARLPSPRNRAIGIACMAVAIALASWVVLRLLVDHAKWRGTPPVWIASVVLALLGASLIRAVGEAAPRAASARVVWSDSRRNQWLELAAFLAIFLLAIFLRTYRLDTIPPGIFVDETNGALDALYILEGRPVSPFTTGWYGTPNGYFYYMAEIFRLFGANWYSLKLASILPALLTVPAVYLLARQLFGPLAGLSAMLLMAVSRWHLTMSRWGWNETAPPLFQVLAFCFLLRGLRDRRALDYALCGALLGLSQYTYLSSRLVVLTLAVFALYWCLSDASGLLWGLRRSWVGLTIAFVVAVVAAAPILVTYVTDPFAFGNRVSQVSVIEDVRAQGSYVPLIGNITDILKFFHQTGDANGRHNLPGEPMADPFTGLLFGIGLAYAIAAWRDQRSVLLLLWLVIGLAGSFLSTHQDSPQAYRTLTALPAVVMLAGGTLERGARATYGWLRTYSPAGVRSAVASLGAAGVIIVFLAGATVWESSVYFGPQANSMAVLRSFNATENGVARETIAALNAGQTVYLAPGFSFFSPLRFLVYGVYKSKFGRNTLDDPPYHMIVPAADLPISDDGQDVLVLLDLNYWPVRGFISSLYPNSRMDIVLLADGSPMYMRVQIPRSDIQSLQGLTQDVAFSDGHHETNAVQEIAAFGPDPRITQVTWEGAIRLEHGGQYEFRSAGSLEVSVDGEPFQGAHYLGRGLYALRVVSMATAGGEASLQWKIGDGDFIAVPAQALFRLPGQQRGLLSTYWSNVNWEGTPAFRQVTPFLLLAWGDEQPIMPSGPFSARFAGSLQISDAGMYQFRVEADDGARLTLDGEVLGEGLKAGQPNSFEASTNLAAGDHPIQIDYFQQGGGSSLRLYWRRSAEEPWTPVPPEALIPAQP